MRDHSSKGRVAALTVATLALASCLRSNTSFVCASDQQCVFENMVGRCELSGDCSFPDDLCVGSGWRYGLYAEPSLAGTCVALSTDLATARAMDGDSTDLNHGHKDKCGASGQPCCAGASCNAQFICMAGSCL
jgi:hypothetical protein